MKITDNKQAKNTLDNMVDSITNRVSEVYNLGYKDGYESGMRNTINEIIEYANYYEPRDNGNDRR